MCPFSCDFRFLTARRLSSSPKMIFPFISTIFLATLHGRAFAQADDQDRPLVFAILHSFESGPESVYTTRATATVQGLRSGKVTLQQTPLTNSDISKLRKLAEYGGIYRVRVADRQHESQVAATFMKACSLYESKLTDSLTLTLDQSGVLVGVSDFSGHQCQGAYVPDHRLANFNSSFSVSVMKDAPFPDTQTYVRRMEQEKAEKARGENVDNRSFFAKYWMYIVPVLIFLLISGAYNPEGQGGGR
ncbi:ER membrane protein complex subunit 10-like isoform X2 [Ornithodoros turicata]|uniref:ER membrane protein complex subunit 10-like isoform X2 n=1 Tax=Ornithodoros turicata TaxID=34597 RepID=UPI0031394CA2